MGNHITCTINILILFLCVKCLNGAEGDQRKYLENISDSNRTKAFLNHESQEREDSLPSGMHPIFFYLR